MQSVAVLDRHQLVWRDPPVWPFMWRGLLPLLALALLAGFALGPFARDTVQAGVEQQVREQLRTAGFGWVGVQVSGQSVSLSGEEPAAGAGERAVALARSASCPTLLGRRTCATQVAARFTVPAPPPAEPAATAAPTAAAGTPAIPAHGTLTAPGHVSAAQACERTLASELAGEQIQFSSGRAAIDPGSAGLLDRLAREVRGCPGTLRIEGYTDTVGRGRVNRALSEKRAAAVREALIARGVPAARLKARGFGARRAIADNATEAGRAKNRRIEFHVLSAD
ncbi:MAG: OmpA family protein [Steroidobacterales bacterium]|jgi:outer membrane protein OmpA-like peptidoglycan-associated protein